MTICPLEFPSGDCLEDRKLVELLRLLAFAVGLGAFLVARWLASAPAAPEPAAALNVLPWIVLGLTGGGRPE